MNGIPAIKSKGKRYGRLFVLNIFYKKSYPDKAWAKCRCDCDKHLPKEERKIIKVQLISLRHGRTQSCGCLQKERARKTSTIHGELKNYKPSIEYNIHRHMMQRCYNKNNDAFHNYGGRGIKVYKPWHKVETFIAHLEKTIGRRPSAKYSIDRIDNDGNYEPGNIKWSTKSEQQYNTRRSIKKRSKHK